MSFSATKGPSSGTICLLSIITALVVMIGIVRDYKFLPKRPQVDGFATQIQYASNLISSGDLSSVANDPLAIVHMMRYAVVWPFLAAEDSFGPAGPLFLLSLLIWPLLISFSISPAGWRGNILLASRLIILFFPLFVSGRTVLVTVGMGYLVSGIIRRPFSWVQMLLGCVMAVLSSGSMLFSLAILAAVGNWRDRSRGFYTAKAIMISLVLCLFLPSLIAKIGGFSSGAAGYASEEPLFGEGHPETSLGETQNEFVSSETGPAAAVQRILWRSTVAQSYREGNAARFTVYLGLASAALLFIVYSVILRKFHPLVSALAILSTGILLEGLALWPILFPLLWAYTGGAREKANLLGPIQN